MAKKIIKGLGDEIEVVAEVVGIKKVVEIFNKITGFDCGCDKRKDLLNAKFPNFKNVNCLKKNEYNLLKAFFETNQQLTHVLKRDLNEIYLNVFGINLEIEGCESCWRDYVANLKRVFNAYSEA